MTTISPGAQLAIWGPDSELFQRYSNYFTRLSPETHKPRPEPITEFREALVLLHEPMNDRTRRRIETEATLPDGSRGPVIRIEAFGSGYREFEVAHDYEFLIAPELVEELRRSGIVSPVRRYSVPDPTLLALNEQSVYVILREIEKYRQELEP